MRNNWFISKLNNKAGESLPEVLIAVLVVALGMVMLATLLNVSSKMVDKGQNKVKAVYQEISEMDGGQTGPTSHVTLEDGKNVTIKYNTNQGDSDITAQVSIKLYKGKNLLSYEPKKVQVTP